MRSASLALGLSAVIHIQNENSQQSVLDDSHIVKNVKMFVSVGDKS